MQYYEMRGLKNSWSRGCGGLITLMANAQLPRLKAFTLIWWAQEFSAKLYHTSGERTGLYSPVSRWKHLGSLPAALLYFKSFEK